MAKSFGLPMMMLFLGLLVGVAVTQLPSKLGGDASARNAGVSSAATSAPAAPAPPLAAPASPQGASAVVYTQDEVNAEVTRTLRDFDQPVPVKNVEVTLLGDNKVQATGRATLPFQGETPLTVLLTVGSAAGKFKITVDSVKAGSFPLPQPMVQQLVNQVKTAAGITDLENMDLPHGVESVKVDQGRLVLKKRA
ncbi:MAG: hypothetical protein NTZ05_15720 [Chloroflexi bacterium]|nr:hypothetical protein [Chloroflexota bacterium]